MFVSVSRLRSLISGCRTDPEVVAVLRSHKIRYSYTTETGSLSIKIPCQKGSVRIYRTCSRSAPYMVSAVTPSAFIPAPVPVLHPEY